MELANPLDLVVKPYPGGFESKKRYKTVLIVIPNVACGMAEV